MGIRQPAAQFEHDQVVRQLALLWRDAAPHGGTNPGAQKRFSISPPTIYPDLVGWRVEARAEWMVEVETAATVTEAEARSQW